MGWCYANGKSRLPAFFTWPIWRKVGRRDRWPLFLIGPGAASAYLHMRHWGPQRAVFNEAGSSHMTWPVPLAVNIIIYALTQKGSITQRLMQMVN